MPGQALDSRLTGTSTSDDPASGQVVVARLALGVSVLLLLVAVGRELTR